MTVSNSTIQFRIDIDFEGSDVDVVYQEARQAGFAGIVPTILIEPHTHTIKGDKTPTSGTVDFCLAWLSGYVDRNKMCIVSSKWDKDYSKKQIPVKSSDGFEYVTFPNAPNELEELGLVVKTYGLMMGTCHLICEVPADKFSQELVNKANIIALDVFRKYVRYYPNKKKMRA